MMPLLYFNITPANPNGTTVVDLGEMDEGLEVARQSCHSSLPPLSPTQATHQQRPREARHGSLPPTLTQTRFLSPVEGIDEVSEGESDVIALSVGRGERNNPARVSKPH